MKNLLSAIPQRVGLAVVAAAALAVGGTATAAAVIGHPDTGEVADVSVFTTEPAATTSSPAPEPAPESAPALAPVVTQAARPPVEPAPVATVEGVTTPEAPAPTEAEIVDPESIGTTGTDGNYTPAPPRQNPGEPPVLPEAPPPTAGDADPDLPTG